MHNKINLLGGYDFESLMKIIELHFPNVPKDKILIYSQYDKDYSGECFPYLLIIEKVD